MRPDPLLLLLSTLAFSAACMVVLALRGPMRRRAGAGMAYGLWCLPVLVPLALALPAPRQALVQMQAHADLPVALPTQLLPAAGLHGDRWWLAWLAGALACLGWQAWRQWRFVRALGPLQPLAHPLLPLSRASRDPGLPALVGLWRPRIVLPPDFEHRYDAAQRALLLRHESVHWRRGDPQCNAVATLLLCLQWFNPLAHLAWAAFRRDQEMACDARVLAARPRQRRAYAEAMLIGGIEAPLPPLGCPWPSRHPLRERIEMLKLPAVPLRRRVLAALCVALLGAGGGYVAWAAQPSASIRADGAPRRSHGVDHNAGITMRTLPPPRYPRAAYEQGIAGDVLLEVSVRADGSVSDAVVVESRPAGVFDEVTVAAARQWHFNPRMKNGRPVAGKVRVPVNFALDAAPPAGPTMALR